MYVMTYRQHNGTQFGRNGRFLEDKPEKQPELSDSHCRYPGKNLDPEGTNEQEAHKQRIQGAMPAGCQSAYPECCAYARLLNGDVEETHHMNDPPFHAIRLLVQAVSNLINT